MNFDELSSRWQRIAVENAIDGFEEVYAQAGLTDFDLTEDSPEIQEYLEDHIYNIEYDPYRRDYYLIIEGKY